MILPKLTAELSLKPSGNQYIGEPPIDPVLFESSDSSIDTVSMQACAWSGGPEPLLGQGQIFPALDATLQENIIAVGSIRPLFPSLSIEKEFYQAADLEYTRSFVTQGHNTLLFGILDKVENLYIAREMCWVLAIEGVDIYVVTPDSNRELTAMIGSIASRTSTADLDVIFGYLGPMSKPEQCNGVILPTVSCTQAYNFTYQQMVEKIMSATGADEDQAKNIFSHMLELTDNSGRGNDNRAINFVVLNSIDIYILAYDMIYGEEIQKLDPKNFSLINIMTNPSRIQGEQVILDVIFTYRGNTTNVSQKWFCRVDVSGHYPYLVSGMAKYYNRP